MCPARGMGHQPKWSTTVHRWLRELGTNRDIRHREQSPRSQGPALPIDWVSDRAAFDAASTWSAANLAHDGDGHEVHGAGLKGSPEAPGWRSAGGCVLWECTTAWSTVRSTGRVLRSDAVTPLP